MAGRRFMAGLAAVVMLAGCGADSDAPASGSSGPATRSSAPPDPQARLREATPAPAGLASLGVPSTAESETAQEYLLSDVCGEEVRGGRGQHESFTRIWSSPEWWVSIATHRWTAEKGRTMVAAVRTAAKKCKTYKSGADKIKIFDVIEVAPVDGIDATYAHCEKITHPGEKEFPLCRVFLARGPYVSSVSVRSGGVASTKQGVAEVAELAANALAAAG